MLLDGQVRIVGSAVAGWDMGAAFALAEALGVDARAVAELLPAIEPVMAMKVNEGIAGRDG